MKDTKQGYGVASSASGCLYEGTWHNGQHEGYGVEVYKDGGRMKNWLFYNLTIRVVLK